MHTEDEARQKWCPQFRTAPGHEEMGLDNRLLEYTQVQDKNGLWLQNPTGRLDPSCCCIASQCMAWRIGKPTQHADGCAATRTQMDPPEEQLPCDCTPVSLARGYCGLAGRPE